MEGWGYNGSDLKNVKYVHSSVYGNLTIGFKTKKEADAAHQLTGWQYFNDAVLGVSFFDDVVFFHPANGKMLYYGYWEIQEDQGY